ncbi:MAG: DUF2314 domain-containing protein [Myxococcales bacterium]|nr:DUF2314 domain-containing protein [Myxococcales bacterium]
MKSAPPTPTDRRGLFLIGGLVLLLGGIVWWSLAKAPPAADPSAAASASGAPPSSGSAEPPSRPAPRALERLTESGFEIAVLTDKTEEELAPIVDPKSVAKLVSPRFCGASCEKVRATMVDKEHFETEVIKTEDWQLPPEESFPTIAPGLSADERARLKKLPNVVVVRAHAKASREQWAARAGFAAAAALADHLRGYVYDEVVRRIETAEQFATHAITELESDGAFRPDRIVIQSYRQEDGTSRLLTLGMVRFGVVDLEVRGVAPTDTARAGMLLNAVAARLASGEAKVPMTLAAAEVARANQRSLGEIGATERGSATVDLVETDRTEGDPDNEMLRVVPSGARPSGGDAAPGDPDALDHVFASLFSGPPPVVRVSESDPALKKVKDDAQKALPRLAKAQRAGAELTLKAELGGGDAGIELMWVKVASCAENACTGTLANGPVLLTSMRAGDTVRVPFAKVVDYLLRTEDGGVEGGASIRVLSGAAP